MDKELLASIGAIYETAISAGRWSSALDAIAAATDGLGALLMVRDDVDLQVDAMSTRFWAPRATQYLERLDQGSESEWLDVLATAPAGTVLRNTDLWPDRAEYEALPSMQFLRRFHIYHRCAARISSHGGWMDTIAVVYQEDRPEISDEQCDRLRRLLPHLGSAVAAGRPFLNLERRYRDVLGMLDRLGIGVLLLEADLSIVLANSEAERLLDDGNGICRDPRGRLASPQDENQQQLARGVRNGAATARLDSDKPGEALLLARGDADPLMVDCIPFRDDYALGESFTGVLMLIVDPEARAMVSIRGLASSYGLTDAERAVCRMIVDGSTTREIAEDRRVSLGTVKSQTSTILEKTRTRNRAELVKRALTILPPILDERGNLVE